MVRLPRDAAQPTWSLTVPSATNLFQGGTTIDGTAVWTNRGNPVENWGIYNDSTPMTPQVQGGVASWKNSTYYSLVSVVIDTNGNLQQVVTPGLSATTTPNWSKVLGGKTYDGAFPTGSPSTGVMWQMVASAAMLNWQANTNYPVGSFLVEQVSGASVSPGTLVISPLQPSSVGVSAPTRCQAVVLLTRGLDISLLLWNGNSCQQRNVLLRRFFFNDLVLNNPNAVAETSSGTATSPNTAPLCLFQSGSPLGPYIAGPISAYAWAAAHNVQEPRRRYVGRYRPLQLI